MEWNREVQEIHMTLVIRGNEALAYLPSVPGQHFPITIEKSVLERIKTLKEEEMICPECHGTGSDGWSFCKVCNGKGRINKHHNSVPRRSNKRNGRLINHVPKREGHNDRKPLY